MGVQIKARRFNPWLYWATIVASTTAGTTLADFADRSLGIGYPGGSLLLFTCVLMSLLGWYRSLGSIDINTVSTPKAESFYWLTITFSQTLGTALGDWVADIRKVKQVVINLLSNALKFTPRGGRVQVIAERSGSSVQVSVCDTGYFRAMNVPLLTRVTLFDVYTGGQVGAGRRSLAWSLTFQAPDRTLTDAEVNQVHSLIVAEVAQRFRAEVRGA